MGYNNHHAGMHMIWSKRYAPYEDLSYYDKLAEEKRMRAKIVYSMIFTLVILESDHQEE